MNPFSSTTASDFGVQASDIVNSGFSLVYILGAIVVIGLAINMAPKAIRLIRYALGNKSVYDSVPYSKSEFLAESKYDKNNKFHPDRYYKGLTRNQKYKEYLRVTDNGKKNYEW